MARRPRHLSTEERALWSSVAASATPMQRPVPEKMPEPFQPKPVKEAAVQRQAIQKFDIGQMAGRGAKTETNLRPTITDHIAAAPLNMDKNTFRKLARGRVKPEGRIDLHGMTLAQARPALIGFVLASHSAGKRLILVITGKGRTDRDSGGPIPERKGVLRDQVPRWLSSLPLGPVVMQVANPHASHGGTGAYYVYLRRARK